MDTERKNSDGYVNLTTSPQQADSTTATVTTVLIPNQSKHFVSIYLLQTKISIYMFGLKINEKHACTATLIR